MLHVSFSGIDELIDNDVIEDTSKPYFMDESMKMKWNSDIMKSVLEDKADELDHYRDFSVDEKVSLCVLMEKMYIDVGLMLNRDSTFWSNVNRLTPLSKQMSIPLCEVEVASDRCRREHGLLFGVNPRLTMIPLKRSSEGKHPYEEFLQLFFMDGNLMNTDFPNEGYRSPDADSNGRNVSQQFLLSYLEKTSANRMEVESLCRSFRCARITVLVWEHIRVLFYVLDCFSCWKEEKKRISEGILEAENANWSMFDDVENLADFVSVMVEDSQSIPVRTPGVFEEPKISYPWLLDGSYLIGLLI